MCVCWSDFSGQQLRLICRFFPGLDDSASAASSMEVTDRIASLEQRVQMQEDDIQLLKSALADVVRRLSVAEEQQAALSRKGPTRGARCRRAGRRRRSLLFPHFKYSFLKCRSSVDLQCCGSPRCATKCFSSSIHARALSCFSCVRLLVTRGL